MLKKICSSILVNFFKPHSLLWKTFINTAFVQPHRNHIKYILKLLFYTAALMPHTYSSNAPLLSYSATKISSGCFPPLPSLPSESCGQLDEWGYLVVRGRMDRDHVHSDHGDDDYINASSILGACCGPNSNQRQVLLSPSKNMT